jgi:hypothetical protein
MAEESEQECLSSDRLKQIFIDDFKKWLKGGTTKIEGLTFLKKSLTMNFYFNLGLL